MRNLIDDLTRRLMKIVDRRTKIIVYTQAYNAENTLARTIESILNQTHKNLIYYILDNGSTDRTGEIILEYAKKDRRIIPLKNELNNVWKKNAHWLHFIKNHNSRCFLTVLDADDEYLPDFLEKMIAFVKKNKLSAALCGTDWVEENTGRLIKRVVLDEDLLLKGKGFAQNFPVYRNFLTTVWGGIYSLGLLKQCSFRFVKYAVVFSDTAVTMEIFQKSGRAGILAESLHKYHVSQASSSYKYTPGLFRACKYLNDISREYLLNFDTAISRQNEDYLHVQLLILIKYILPRILYADIDLLEKLFCLYEIFRDEMTEYMLKHWTEVGIYSDKEEFIGEIKSWITAQDGWEDYRKLVEEIESYMDN